MHVDVVANADSVVSQFKAPPTLAFSKGALVKDNIPSLGLVEIQVYPVWINDYFSN